MPVVSEIALNTVSAIREILSKMLASLIRMEETLKNAPLGALEEMELPREALRIQIHANPDER